MLQECTVGSLKGMQSFSNAALESEGRFLLRNASFMVLSILWRHSSSFAVMLSFDRFFRLDCMMAKKEKLDPETEELIKWCIEVEGFLVAGGATVAQAQEFIEDQVEWLTDQFYEGLTPEDAAKAAFSDD
jgi:hypothetical protein